MKRYGNNCILVYGDLHLPFHDKRAFDFLADLNREFKPDRVIDLGDQTDQYCFSKYPKDPKALSITEEMKRLRKGIKTLASIFPSMWILESNHCGRLYSKATISGIPREFILPYRDLIGAPDGWRWHKDLTLTVDKTRERIYFCHERGNNVLQLAKSIAMNTVQGHFHNGMSVQYFANPIKEMFAVQCPCLISDEGPPFAYNKRGIYRPLKGAVVIIEGTPSIVRL